MFHKKNDLVTAYVDGEITNPSQVDEIKELIKNDPGIKFDYRAQLLIKSLISEKLKPEPIPENIKNKIIRKINPAGNLFSTRPLIAYGSLIIIFLAIILIIFNRPPQFSVEELSHEQTGENNMFLLAKENYARFLEGSLVPQILSNKPEEIKLFFSRQGIKYEIFIPVFEKWDILGAFLTEEKGYRIAHHIYLSREGTIIYFLQADESFIGKYNVLQLSERLIEFIADGNCFYIDEEGITTLMNKLDQNIIAVVSNIQTPELIEKFCGEFGGLYK